MRDRLRIGVVGLGRIGAEHAVVVAGHPRVGEVVLADAAPGRAAEVAARLGGHGTEARAAEVDALADAGLDGLVVASSTPTHAELVRRFVPLGVAVLCEKPLALDLETTAAVVAEAENHGALLAVGFQRRFDAGYRSAREALRTGKLGELRRAHVVTCDAAPPPEEFISASGGIFKDCLVHDFDVLRWLTGREVVTVHATGVNRGAAYFGAAGDVDEAAAVLTLDDGTLVTAQASRYNGAGYDVRAELAGTRGTVVVGLEDRAPVTSAEPGVDYPPPGPRWPNFWERFLPAYRAEVSAFVDLVDGRPADLAGPQDALAATRVAEAAGRSLAEGRPVDLLEVRG
ncbi:Gfo/Idh/MocA family oxidoreductase [Georgenia alba]|uniref:Gfo/Idh/MocA family oxidoreductase n=1 Tax=Georgenia alba TaxID=2233858 RepID=A0ABW2Q7I5_9MICO